MTTSGRAARRATTIAISAETEIKQSTAHIWQVLADYRRDVDWRRGVTRMEPSPTGPVAVGTTTDEVMRLAGSTYRNLGLVTDVDPGARFGWRTTDGADACGSRSITELSPGRCVVRLELEVRVTGAQRVIAPLLGRMLRRNLRGDVERLRQICESSAIGDRASVADAGGPASTRV